MADNSSGQQPAGTETIQKPKTLLNAGFDPFGFRTIRLNNNLGAIAIFFFRAFLLIFRLKQIPEIIQQIYFIGARSAQIVMLVGFFTHMRTDSYGTKSVSLSTTSAVVISCVMILISDYVVTSFTL